MSKKRSEKSQLSPPPAKSPEAQTPEAESKTSRAEVPVPRSSRPSSSSQPSKVLPGKEKKKAWLFPAKQTKPTSPWRGLIIRLAVAGLLFLALLIGTVIAAGRLKTWTQEAEVARSQLTVLARRGESRQMLEVQLSQLADEAGLLDSALLTETALLELLDRVNTFREQAGAETATVSFTGDEPRVDSAGNYYLELSLAATGSQESLLNLAESFLHQPYLYQIAAFQLKSLETEPSELVLQARFYLNSEF